jgi:predicted ATP-grasp superfamily ATP-dependent carboligase
MARYAIAENDDGSYRLLEHNPATGKWRRLATDLNEDDLADEVYAILEDGDLDANTILARHDTDGSRTRVAAIDLVRDWQRRQLGYVIATQPVMRKIGDPAGRRHSL